MNNEWEDIDGWEDVGEAKPGLASQLWKKMGDPKNYAQLLTDVSLAPIGIAEAAVGGIGDMANAAVSGLTGMVKAPFTDKSAADEIRGTQEAIAKAIPYAPETHGGKALLDVLSLPAVGAQKLGELGFEGTGSPAVGAGVETMANALMMAPGLRARKPIAKELPDQTKIDKLELDKIVEERPWEQMELPLETPLQRGAEVRAEPLGQLDLFGPINRGDQVVGKVTPDEV